MTHSAQVCPACRHHFVPWQLWRTSTRSGLQCPSCKSSLIRRMDRQFFGIFLLQVVLSAGIYALTIPEWLQLVGWTAVAIAGYVLDALTVRLVAAA